MISPSFRSPPPRPRPVAAALLVVLAAASGVAGDGDAIAIVNGQAITKTQLVDLLMEAHGLSAMQQLIVLELARQETRRRSIEVTDADIQTEFRRSVERVAPEVGSDGASLTDEEKRMALERLLAQKGLSMAEFMLGMQRNAHLRKLVEKDFRASQQTLREEFARTYGEKVQVRHMQLADNEVNEALDLLKKGTDFADLARRLSHNAETAARGGELAPFTFDDEAVPAGMREVAFSLGAGEVSSPIRLGKWIHILKLEKRIPPENVSFEEVREKVEARLRERVIPQEMSRLVQELFQKADVKVLDPKLKKGYEDLLRRNAAADATTQP